MRLPLVLAGTLLCGAAGCSLKNIALGSVADSLSQPGKTFARDDDPEVIRDSIPVILKMMESIHDSLPRHKNLLVALCQTATSFGAGFLKPDADRLQEKDVHAAKALYTRARRMFLRGRNYGLDGLDIAVPGLKAALLHAGATGERDVLLAKVQKKDVPLLYWTAAAWGSAIGVGKDDLQLVGELSTVGALMQRALVLDESWQEGAIHDFFIVYDGARSEAQGGGPARAKQHLERALALSHGKTLSPLVSYAESVTIDQQNKKEFERLLKKVLAFDVDSDLDHRLVNMLAQRRAQFLMEHEGDLFAD